MFRSNSKFVIINKTYRPREWSILHWLYVDAVKAEFVNILKKLDTYSISTISRDETLISRLTRLFPPKTGLQWWSNGGSRGGSRGAGPPPPPRPYQTGPLFETTLFPGFSPTHRAGKREPWERSSVWDWNSYIDSIVQHFNWQIF